jgi:hypothetical protein
MRHSKTGVLHADGDTGFACYCIPFGLTHLRRDAPLLLELHFSRLESYLFLQPSCFSCVGNHHMLEPLGEIRTEQELRPLL